MRVLPWRRWCIFLCFLWYFEYVFLVFLLLLGQSHNVCAVILACDGSMEELGVESCRFLFQCIGRLYQIIVDPGMMLRGLFGIFGNWFHLSCVTGTQFFICTVKVCYFGHLTALTAV